MFELLALLMKFMKRVATWHPKDVIAGLCAMAAVLALSALILLLAITLRAMA